MPLLIVILIVVLAPLVVITLMPLGLMQRYRAGTVRRAARGWVATLNVAALSFSGLLFISSAAITNIWVPKALTYSLAGFAGGCLLGLLGLALTRWERSGGQLHYTPNRLLVLAIVLLVTARLVYGFWRMWQGWHLGADDRSWLIHSGIAGSLAAGAVVLGYSLSYWIGVSRRMRQKK